MSKMYSLPLIVIIIFAWVGNVFSQIPPEIQVNPNRSTSPVIYEAKDPAIWIHPTDPTLSLILGVDIGTYPRGGVYVWDIEGNMRQRLNLSHPSNIDVEYGLELGGESIDFAAVTMRDHDELRIFKIDPVSRTLTDITTDDKIATSRSPFSLTLYKRSDDSNIFAIVSNKPVDEDEYPPDKLWQLRLENDGTGKVKGTLVRVFGNNNLVHGMIADDDMSYLYVVEENVGINKYYADPERGDQRSAIFPTNDGIAGSLNSIALYACDDSTGYILVSAPDERVIRVYPRQGDNGSENSYGLITSIRNRNRAFGYGLDAVNRTASDELPGGFLVWQNKTGKQFQIYSWTDIAQNFLRVCGR